MKDFIRKPHKPDDIVDRLGVRGRDHLHPYSGGLFNGALKRRGAILDAVKASQL